MKYLKLFEKFDAFDEDDWDFEEEYVENSSYKDIPIYKQIGDSFDEKDRMRIISLLTKAKDFDHSLKLATTMANSITHIDKAIKRGNFCLVGGHGLDSNQKVELAKIFHDRAKKLYFG